MSNYLVKFTFAVGMNVEVFVVVESTSPLVVVKYYGLSILITSIILEYLFTINSDLLLMSVNL